jgi:hypothetical protein
MHQKFDAHGLSRIWRHVHHRVIPGLVIIAQVEDRLQDHAVGIGDVSVLPVERNAVSGAVPVPEAQRAGTSRYDELLIERAVPTGLASREPAEAIGRVAGEA